MPRATRLAPAPQGSNAGSMAGILILMVALTAMVVLFIMTNKRVVSDGTPAPAPEPVDPFAHMDYSEDDAEATDWDEAGELSAVREFNADRWDTVYDFPAVTRGDVVAWRTRGETSPAPAAPRTRAQGK